MKPLVFVNRVDDGLERALVGGIGAGLATSFVANVAGAFAGQASLPGREIPPHHVLVAAIGANVIGAFVLRGLRMRVARPTVAYAALASFSAAVATMVLLARSPSPALLRVAAVLHVVVAVGSTVSLPFFYPRAAPSAGFSRGATTLTTVGAIVTAAASQVADFNASHLYHPDWTPHARYHAMLVIGMMTGLGLLSLALVWRPAPPVEQRVQRSIAAMIGVVVWTPFLFALAVPETSSWPDDYVHRMPINGNLMLAAVMIALSGASILLDRRARAGYGAQGGVKSAPLVG